MIIPDRISLAVTVKEEDVICANQSGPADLSRT